MLGLALGSVQADFSVSAKAPMPQPRWWPRMLVLGVVLLIAVWIAFGGYDQPTRPNPRWKLQNGDTIEVLTFKKWRDYSVTLEGKTEVAQYLWLQFRSTLSDQVRDSSDVRAAATVLCPLADSNDVRRIKIEPSRTAPLGFLTYSRSHWFETTPGGACQEVVTHN